MGLRITARLMAPLAKGLPYEMRKEVGRLDVKEQFLTLASKLTKESDQLLESIYKQKLILASSRSKAKGLQQEGEGPPPAKGACERPPTKETQESKPAPPAITEASDAKLGTIAKSVTFATATVTCNNCGEKGRTAPDCPVVT